ncbi:uncharacterized protein PGTG_18400 [Puccinia graminis f. sp. tritici CRL 75-36-700-3]|uniref:Uncharacterized protein n=1 Tax=Puccinia graminis f. sp. tritici (strain CRL 75-36-700-3 / race SCCL) TaxID=418459 RepID=E3L5X4_PUCGT|nr:uncharacterized protein PGTG_18400 [Puccinia graminis f. sp. tritici CRL 75-36-700-3]EFP91949.1 hypothetical protein PGTG_18400 [Puccinia graminis f. sp. tritici CRL 75-36-700-3]
MLVQTWEDVIFGDSIPTNDCIPPGSLLSTSERIAPVFRSIFIHDLSISDFPGVTFAWDHPWDSPWNQIFAKFVLKHWRNGYTSGAFAPFFMNPVEAVNTILQLGILHRWFLGRQKGVRLGQFSHEIKAKKSKSEKKSKIRIQPLQKDCPAQKSLADRQSESRNLRPSEYRVAGLSDSSFQSPCSFQHRSDGFGGPW